MNFSSVKRWTPIISSFLAGQGFLQLLNAITGFLLLRWLSVEAYAQYSVAFGFQNTLIVLVDLGFSGSIIALVGNRVSDKEVVGTYIRSAKRFRNRLFAIAIPVAAVAFPLVTSQQNWAWTTKLLLFASIIGTLFFQGWVSYYSTPLLMNQRVRQYYQPQIITASVRVVLCFVLYFVSALSSWVAAWVYSFVLAVTGLLYRRSAKNLVTEPINSSHKTNHEMLHYLLPLIPAIAFTAFQSQISLAIITIFGQTKSIAEVAALGRLGQLFALLNAFNSVIISPYIAKVACKVLTKKYFQILGCALIIAITLSIAAFLFPQPLLFLLGSKYQSLRVEIGWAVAAYSFNYISNLLYGMNANRKWIYWWGSAFEITLIVIVQVVCISFMNLSNTLQVLYFTLIVSVSYALLHLTIGSYGLIQNHRICSEMKE